MIVEKIKKIIIDQLELKEKNLDAKTSFENLGIDSLELFQIIIEVEEEFKIEIEDVDEIKTIEDLIEVVNDKVKNREVNI
ncbi:acyl carrier protein [Clostridium luticellarii]|jgi:acyl carrier protein|uniref:Acyl carrier protein n=1 Tax=Clostridium luticellarii TaxID=1691940 RepID=A0A2T0BP38_9CLOT|nr:acyl carrier protein [Clostridium luticellarii]MCI1944645.1 acyl carrier protein [Clostridium luticellarii]MCI1968144.1 acyl carrier protein [Clostridium luticellarii]MCI1994743.1 acyl carrier protein [Clostridium luticellarii]MCI2038975.1 acyl carrier protein [Clostridium luticellarii]PRR85649.1 Acyl carrier protein [Clostridium luticellarii]